MANSTKINRSKRQKAILESDESSLESDDVPLATSTQNSVGPSQSKGKRNSRELTAGPSKSKPAPDRNEGTSSVDQSTTMSSVSTGQRNSISQELNVDAMHYEKQLEDATKYFLMACNELKAVKKVELKKFLNIECTKSLTRLIRDLSHKLHDKYGYEMVEYVKDKFILVKAYNSEATDDPTYNFEEPERSKVALIGLIACCVFMNKDSIYLNQLLAGLKSFDISDDFMHPVLGNVKTLITKELVKDGFLKIEKDEKTSGSAIANEDALVNAKVTLGARGEAMINRKQILNHVAKVYGNDPKDWQEQYAIAHALETESSVSSLGQTQN